MAEKQFSAEQIIINLREAEVRTIPVSEIAS